MGTQQHSQQRVHTWQLFDMYTGRHVYASWHLTQGMLHESISIRTHDDLSCLSTLQGNIGALERPHFLLGHWVRCFRLQLLAPVRKHFVAQIFFFAVSGRYVLPFSFYMA